MTTTERLQAAGGTTKRYLAALGIAGWLKLGGIVLLFSIGASSGMNVLGVLTPDSSIGAINPGQLAAPVAVALVAAGGLGYIAAVADFVFVASLRTGRLPVRSYAKANLRRAGWLFAFRALTALGAVAIVAAAIVATVGLTPPTTPAAVDPGEGLLIGLATAIAVLGWLSVGTLTNAFVVPIMQYEHRGPLAAWRRFIGAISGRWTGVAVFVLIAFVISAIVGVALFVVSFFVMSIGGLVLVGGGVLITETAPALEPLVAAVLVAGYLVYRYVIALLRAPVRSYLRYYALLLLGDTDPTLAMLAADLTGGTDGEEPAADTPTEADSGGDDPTAATSKPREDETDDGSSSETAAGDATSDDAFDTGDERDTSDERDTDGG